MQKPRLHVLLQNLFTIGITIATPTLTSAAEPVLQPDDSNAKSFALGGVLYPHIHASGVAGFSTAAEIANLASGHHDPQTDLTAQSLELGLSLRAEEHLQGFVVFSAYSDAERDFDGEFEEAFLKLTKLPGGFEARGGRFYNRFGFQNAAHNHSWDFVNQNLVNGRLLMEGELVTEGGELTWKLPTPFLSALSISIGQARGHQHDHGVHDESHDEHGHAELHHEEHDHEEGRHGVDSHLAGFDDLLYGANLIGQFDYNDFYQNRVTLSAAYGENGFGKRTTVAGAGYEWLWRENGYQPGGRFARWRSEVIYRRFGAVEEDDGAEGTFEDVGFSTAATYGFGDRIEGGLRVDWVSGNEDADLDQRWRITPSVTLFSDTRRTAFVRLQYDLDRSDDWGTEHSVWLQAGFNWGGPEVR